MWWSSTTRRCSTGERKLSNISLCVPTDAPPLSVVTATDAESFLSPSGPIAARARDAHNAMLQASRLPWWKTLGETSGDDCCSPAHLQELEAGLGGLFVGGVSKLSETDGVNL